MHNCVKCTEEKRTIKNDFDVVGKTYYKIDKNTILCYRHWYQLKKPSYQVAGDYYTVTKDIKNH